MGGGENRIRKNCPERKHRKVEEMAHRRLALDCLCVGFTTVETKGRKQAQMVLQAGSTEQTLPMKKRKLPQHILIDHYNLETKLRLK